VLRPARRSRKPKRSGVKPKRSGVLVGGTVPKGLRGRVAGEEDGDTARCRLVPQLKVNKHLLKFDSCGQKVTSEFFKKDRIV